MYAQFFEESRHFSVMEVCIYSGDADDYAFDVMEGKKQAINDPRFA